MPVIGHSKYWDVRIGWRTPSGEWCETGGHFIHEDGDDPIEVARRTVERRRAHGSSCPVCPDMVRVSLEDA
jgi:hypothetical protein